jgi:hypothetical protein
MRLFALIAALSAIAGLSLSAIAVAGTSGRFVLADSGSFAGTDWQFGMARVHRERCYAFFTTNELWAGELKVCGNEPPPKGWTHPFGENGEDGEPSFDLELTAPRIHELNLLLGYPGSDREPSWHRLPTHVLNVRQARKSHMPRDFRFAVMEERQPFCVEAVEGLDRWGHVLVNEAVPCEY